MSKQYIQPAPPLPWMPELHASPGKPIPQQSNIAYFISQAEGQLKDLGSFMVSTSPIVAAARSVRRQTGGTGNLGQLDEWQRLGLVAGTLMVGIVVLTGALSYQAGKAMAPNQAAKKSWGWIGVPVGLLTGPWGLGVMGVVSNSRK